MNPWPCSVALARVSKSRGSWLAALSFHPRRLFGPSDVKVLQLMRRMVLNHRQQQQVYARLKDSMFGLVRCLTSAIDAKDPYTWGHSERVARMAVRLGQQTGMPPAALSDLYLAGLLHDIGKIGINDDVLRKPGRLTAAEYEHMKTHTTKGAAIVETIPNFAGVLPIIRSHHERWDGSGYPDGHVRDGISLLARVVSVADAFDAMTSERPYRVAMPLPVAFDEIAEKAGSHFDPECVAAFLKLREQIQKIMSKQKEQEEHGDELGQTYSRSELVRLMNQTTIAKPLAAASA